MKVISMSSAFSKCPKNNDFGCTMPDRDAPNWTRTLEIKALKENVKKISSNYLLIARKNRAAENVREVSKELAETGLGRKLFEAIKYVGHRGLYYQRHQLTKIEASAERRIQGQPGSDKNKVLPKIEASAERRIQGRPGGDKNKILP
ncbi:hypothetical protein QZM22_26055 [Burkholderia oklahomensis]|uniref:hypothetical protein n=1 Tax=Burkholderia oklahomensis TaxID=342113 RepID=UPI002652FF48|nr:hypothetical protein [Burkholderia oklahomensis]MDN7675866.1 hypothetical protein [Burkholderia oklahomensis]